MQLDGARGWVQHAQVRGSHSLRHLSEAGRVQGGVGHRGQRHARGHPHRQLRSEHRPQHVSTRRERERAWVQQRRRQTGGSRSRVDEREAREGSWWHPRARPWFRAPRGTHLEGEVVSAQVCGGEANRVEKPVTCGERDDRGAAHHYGRVDTTACRDAQCEHCCARHRLWVRDGVAYLSTQQPREGSETG